MEEQEIVKCLHSLTDKMDTIIQKKAFLAELESHKNLLIDEYVTGKKEAL